jgi:hypothetical protein
LTYVFPSISSVLSGPANAEAKRIDGRRGNRRRPVTARHRPPGGAMRSRSVCLTAVLPYGRMKIDSGGRTDWRTWSTQSIVFAGICHENKPSRFRIRRESAGDNALNTMRMRRYNRPVYCPNLQCSPQWIIPSPRCFVANLGYLHYAASEVRSVIASAFAVQQGLCTYVHRKSHA